MNEERAKIIANLEKIIREKGYLKSAVAEKAGLTLKDLSDILHDRKIFRAEYVNPICKALGISPNELFK